MSERVLSGAPASPGLAIGRARVLSHPSEDPARGPLPPREPRPRPSARAPPCGGRRGARAHRRAAPGAGPRRRRRDRRDRRAHGGRPDARLRRLRAAVMERGLGAAAALDRGDRGARRRDRVAARPSARRPGRRRSLARAARRAHRRPARPTTRPRANGSAFVLVAEDLGPADVAEHGERLAGIALSAGGVTAHAAIVARSLGIPMTVLAGPSCSRSPTARRSSWTAARAR